MEREENALVLDYLPNGYPLEKRRMPLIQAIGTKNFILLELIPRKGTKIEIKENVYIGPEKREKIYFIKGRLPKEKLTKTSKMQLQEFIEKIVEENEKRFVKFFNEAQAINTRLHQLELLPGFGKKHMKAIIEERKKGEFKDFKDIKERIKNIPDPKKVIEKKLFEELTERTRYNLFAG